MGIGDGVRHRVAASLSSWESRWQGSAENPKWTHGVIKGGDSRSRQAHSTWGRPAYRRRRRARRAFQARAAHAGELMRNKLLQSASPGNIMATAMDAKEFAEKLPGRINKVMDALAEGQLTLNVQGIDDKELMRGVQKLANRLTTGMVVAALVIGAALIMRIDARPKLFGYPAIAIVLFSLAATAAGWLLISIALSDLPQLRHRRRP